MNVSVILAVEAGCRRLSALLSALRYQAYDAFEVVLVTGAPRTSSNGNVKVVECSPWRRTRAKNLGAMSATGDILAFLDSTCVPDVLWLKELAATYCAPCVAGVGGPIHGSDDEPCCAADRLGNRLDAGPPPHWAYQLPHTDRFVSLHAGNCSFRRSVFLEVGGFDEEIGEYLHQIDLCMRLTDRGYLLRPCPHAVVYQAVLAPAIAASDADAALGNEEVKNRVRFAVRSHNALTPRDEVLGHWEPDTDAMDRAVCEGIALAVQDRHHAPLQPETLVRFRPFELLEPQGSKFTICFTVSHFPPTSSTPFERQTWNKARGLAERGHDIHVFVGTDGHATDFENGVWVHRVSDDAPACFAIHRGIRELADTRPIDLIAVSGWEGIQCVHDRMLNCVVILTPPWQMRLEDWPACQITPELQLDMAREQLLLQAARSVVVSGTSLLRRAQKCHGVPFAPTRIHLCPPVIPDRAADFSPHPSSAVRILFVGALRRDYGADLLLQATADLLRAGCEFEVALAGDADGPSEFGPSYRSVVERDWRGLHSRVQLLGELSEDGLFQALADCAVVCLPYLVDAAAISCLEAMMFGKAVVASDWPSARETLGGHGLLCRPGDVESLTTGLRTVIADVDLRNRLSHQGRQAYESAFAPDRALDTTLNVYAQLVDAAAFEETAR
jgi:glycogen(starch) synthase